MVTDEMKMVRDNKSYDRRETSASAEAFYSDRIETLVLEKMQHSGRSDSRIRQADLGAGETKLWLRGKVVPFWMLRHERPFIRIEMEEAVGENFRDELRAG